MSMSFTPAEILTYFAPYFSDRQRSDKREHRGPCPVHKGRNNNFVIDVETGLCFCFSKCNRGWDMIGLDQELFGGDFKTSRQRVFAAVGRRWDELPPEELARLAEQRKQDETDEAMAHCWRRGYLQHIDRQLADDKAHLFAGDPGDRKAARIRVKQYSDVSGGIKDCQKRRDKANQR